LPGLPPGSEILGGRSIRELIPQLLEKIKPRQTVEPLAPNPGLSLVYINYDTTLAEDSSIAARITDIVRDRNLEPVRSGRDGEHDQLMRTANGVIVVRAAHPDPDQWLKLNAMELALAGQIFERKLDFAAKALLVDNPSRIHSFAGGVPVYSYSEPFTPATLQPFFDKLTTARPLNVDG
jgi:hypothetical protein